VTAIEKKPSGVRPVLLSQIRAARPAKPQVGTAPAAPTARRPRLVFAFDATASRESAWKSAQEITGRMFGVIPEALDVALAVHGGDDVHTFTAFSTDVDVFRQQAAAVTCRSGTTRLCDIMARTLDAGGVRVMSYIGDAFEEDADEALELADRFRLRGIQAVMLSDGAEGEALDLFRRIAERTGGALLDFRTGDSAFMGELLAGVAMLAIGGRKLLEAQHTAGARMLLTHLAR
jgi:hypothetical protein